MFAGSVGAADEAPQDFDVRMRAGWLALQQKHYSLAIDHYSAAVELSEGNGTALFGLASALNGKGRFDEAVPIARRAVEATPDKPRPRLELAFALYNLDRINESLEQYNLIIETHPDNTDALSGMGWCLYKLGNRDEAREHFDRALSLEPGHGPSMEGKRALAQNRIDFGVTGLLIIGDNTPSFSTGGGVATFIDGFARRVRIRAAYRVVFLDLANDVESTSDNSPSGSSGSRPSTSKINSVGAHFAAVGVDYLGRRVEAGLLGGVAGTSDGSWLAGVAAARIALLVRARLVLESAVLPSSNGIIWQITPRVEIPATSVMSIWAGARITDSRGDWLFAGEAGLRFSGTRWSLDLWGGYGPTDSPLVYDPAILKDYRELLVWLGAAAMEIIISPKFTLSFAYEAAGTLGEDVDMIERSGMVHTISLGMIL
jgi:hypothetical protein